MSYIEYCNKCGKDTTWTSIGRVRDKCDECGLIFPCKHKCIHIDCAEAKEAKKKVD